VVVDVPTQVVAALDCVLPGFDSTKLGVVLGEHDGFDVEIREELRSCEN
jgi:hypothetical protein